MSEYVIVRINAKLIPDYQISYNTQSKQYAKSRVTSWAEINKSADKKIILILDAANLYQTKVKIPSKSEDIIRQSLPFALEEQLSNDIEDNHYAYTTENEQLTVTVIAKSILDEINNKLAKYKINCRQLFSEIYTVPTTENAISFCQIDDYCIVNKQNLGTTIASSQCETYSKLCGKQQKILFNEDGKSLSDKTDYIVKKHAIALLQATNLLASIKHKKAINIFQGDYSKSKDNKKRTNKSKLTLLALTALILSWLSISLLQLWQTNAEIKDIKNKQLELLVKLIPNASSAEKNDPYAAIQSRLKQTQSIKTSTANNGFIKALYYLGATLNKHNKIQVQSLRQRDNKLEIKLLAENVSFLNAFQADLAKNALNMRVKTGTRESNKQGILSVITMEKL